MGDVSDGSDGEIIEIKRSGGELTIEWRIPNFFRLPEDVLDYSSDEIEMLNSSDELSDEIPGSFISPSISFCNNCWTLNLESDIEFNPKLGAMMALSFFRHKEYPPRTVYYTFAIKGLDGVVLNVEADQEFSEDGEEFGWPDFWAISDLKNNKSRLVPDNVLTIVGVFKSDEIKISLSSRKRNVIYYRKSLLTEGRHQDFTLKVRNREWLVHKFILEARSEYFVDMFLENTKGEMKFDDVEEDALDSVLQFIYTGEVKDVPIEHVCSIYIAAHKFLLGDLKLLSVETMKKNMGPDIVWEALATAKIYGEEDLKKSALDYLNEDNTVKNLCMRGWEQFEQNHPSIAAEVLKEIDDNGEDEPSNSDDSEASDISDNECD